MAGSPPRTRLNDQIIAKCLCCASLGRSTKLLSQYIVIEAKFFLSRRIPAPSGARRHRLYRSNSPLALSLERAQILLPGVSNEPNIFCTTLRYVIPTSRFSQARGSSVRCGIEFTEYVYQERGEKALSGRSFRFYPSPDVVLQSLHYSTAECATVRPRCANFGQCHP